ncbi:hypothetical protein CAAN1_06S02740 [[Candida] anglica]|uniref:RRM Nup35-type domain-containing protein n=1 Tax=[Candida] anglica TaxID=148631 RepID=A0ABP0ELE9_9ASCO
MSTLFGAQNNSFASQPASGSVNSLFSQSQPVMSTNTTTSNPYSQINSNTSTTVGTVGASNQPTWFQNPKKRTIPNHLVSKKKPGFQISSSSSSSSTNGKKDSKNNKDSSQSNGTNQFNLISFGSSVPQRNASTSVASLYDASMSGDVTKYDETINDTLHEDFSLYNPHDDLPPSRSIYDLNDEVLLSLNKPASSHSDSFLNKNPRHFNNIFNKGDASTGSAIVEANTAPADLENSNATSDQKGEIKPLDSGESAVLVFGYPENMANQVIQHFQEFGNILEEFETTRAKNSAVKYYQYQQDGKKSAKTIVPLFTGNSWVKLTYDNPSSAVTALRESGAVFNGVLLGVIPYTKSAVEKLSKRTLSANEDIGGGLLDLQLQGSTLEPPIENSVADQSPYTIRLDIKDGSGLFLHAKNATDPNKPDTANTNAKLGVFGTVSKFLFGFNEL